MAVHRPSAVGLNRYLHTSHLSLGATPGVNLGVDPCHDSFGVSAFIEWLKHTQPNLWFAGLENSFSEGAMYFAADVL